MKSPAVRFYAADFLTGTDYMSSAEVGFYIRLICYSWLNGGLVDDPVSLGRLGRWDGDGPVPALVLKKFRKGDDGLLRNPRLEEERRKQDEFRAKQSMNASSGWSNRRKAEPVNSGPGITPKVAKPEDDHALEVLTHLNTEAKTGYRPTEANLTVIRARLAEEGVDVPGVKQMITRQVAKWTGTEWQEYLRPATLFAKTKFDGYYAARGMEIPKETHNGRVKTQEELDMEKLISNDLTKPRKHTGQ